MTTACRTLGTLVAAALAAAVGCVGAADLDEDEDLGYAEEAVSQCVEIRRGVSGDVADAYIWSAYPGYNTGTVVDQSVGVSQGGVQQGLIRADLSAVPAGATIDSASLTLTLSSSAPRTLRAHRATASWTEPTVSWNSFGGAYDASVIGTVDVNGYGVERSFDLTALVQAWVSGATPNHGVLLERDPEGTVTYRSSERSTLSQRPKLTVCFTTNDGGTSTSSTSASSTSASSTSASSTSANSTSASSSSSASSGGGGAGGTGGAGGAGGTGGAGGGDEGFVPTDLPGCRWWLRADSVTTSGQYVASVDDKSGNGHVVSQSDPARRATFVSSSPAFNGRPTMHFYKSQYYEKVGGITLPYGSAPMTVFMVGSIDTLPDIGPNGFFAYYGGGATHVYARVQGVNRFRVHAENPYTSTLTAGAQGTAHLFEFGFQQGTLRTWRDGLAGEVFAASMYGTSSSPSMRVGTTDAGTPYSLYGGEIAEIILFDNVLGDASRQQVEAYIKARYGIP